MEDKNKKWFDDETNGNNQNNNEKDSKKPKINSEKKQKKSVKKVAKQDNISEKTITGDFNGKGQTISIVNSFNSVNYSKKSNSKAKKNKCDNSYEQINAEGIVKNIEKIFAGSNNLRIKKMIKNINNNGKFKDSMESFLKDIHFIKFGEDEILCMKDIFSLFIHCVEYKKMIYFITAFKNLSKGGYVKPCVSSIEKAFDKINFKGNNKSKGILFFCFLKMLCDHLINNEQNIFAEIFTNLDINEDALLERKLNNKICNNLKEYLEKISDEIDNYLNKNNYDNKLINYIINNFDNNFVNFLNISDKQIEKLINEYRNKNSKSEKPQQKDFERTEDQVTVEKTQETRQPVTQNHLNAPQTFSNVNTESIINQQQCTQNYFNVLPCYDYTSNAQQYLVNMLNSNFNYNNANSNFMQQNNFTNPLNGYLNTQNMMYSTPNNNYNNNVPTMQLNNSNINREHVLQMLNCIRPNTSQFIGIGNQNHNGQGEVLYFNYNDNAANGHMYANRHNIRIIDFNNQTVNTQTIGINNNMNNDGVYILNHGNHFTAVRRITQNEQIYFFGIDSMNNNFINSLSQIYPTAILVNLNLDVIQQSVLMQGDIADINACAIWAYTNAVALSQMDLENIIQNRYMNIQLPQINEIEIEEFKENEINMEIEQNIQNQIIIINDNTEKETNVQNDVIDVDAMEEDNEINNNNINPYEAAFAEFDKIFNLHSGKRK